ncbi:MAG: two-component system sensor histidine kinase AtoS [Rhodospirillaceae bacterium]|nr:two-component system sensor histidine kinase AtoS [Rhodospirillales bacterium]
MHIRGLLHAHLPKTLRVKLLLMSLLVVSVPIATTAFVVENQGREARQEEKLDKLFGLARILDSSLGDGFDGLRADAADRTAQIALVNAKLRDVTDMVAASSPGVGVGYYSKTLNAIVTYGPSRDYGKTVGQSIAPDHPGWNVMASGKSTVETGHLVRGPIMNAMLPIIRHDQVIGYIWANELTESIERQAWEMDRAILLVTMAGIAFGLALAHALSTRLSRDVAVIKNGLAGMLCDLSHPIRRPSGELGEIAEAINSMAQALLGARSLNENILDSIADGVIAVDVAGRVTSINPAAQALMGVTLRDVVGQPYQSLYMPNAGFVSILLDTLESGKDHIGVALDYPLMDQTLHVNASSSLLKDGNGKMIGAVVVLKDLSEQHRLQKQVMRADRLAALGELVAGIAHEIRNPLTSIRGFMQYLESCESLAEWQRYAPLIVRQVDSLNRIITGLLEFGRHRPSAMAPVRINELIREITVLAGAKSPASITLELASDMPVVEVDGEALKQVILNLVINAIQAIPETGTVTVATRREKDEAVISVADNGVGIAPQDLDKVFDPFFSTKPTGTGLGLAMVHRIVDAHHGSIAIESTPDVGTRVILRLPLIHTEPQA